VKQDVQKWIYPNGLTLIVDEAPQLISVAIAAWVKTGTRHEDLDSAGLCHFLEHMVFKGGKKRGALDISKAVDRVGGDFNAFTSREHTCFHFYLPARELALGSDLLKEILYHPLFAAKEVEKERQVILQEIAMVKDNPEEECFDQYLELFFGKHSLGRQILGSEKSIKGVTRSKLFHFFYQHYRPENMVLSVSGAVSFEKVKKQFASLGEKPWPNRKQQIRKAQWGVDPPKETHRGFHWMISQTEQSHLLYGISSPLHGMKERIASIMVQQYLGGGMSSVLFDQIREKKGWAYTVYANAIHFLDASMFIVYAGVQPDQVQPSIQVIHRELRKIARHGIPTAELKRIKDSLIYSFQLSLESAESRMMAVSTAELFYRKTMSFRSYESMVRSLKGSDIQKLVASWLAASDPMILVLSKKPTQRGALRSLNEFSVRICGEAVRFKK
jgi:predicted Zn-dependent peptidase